MQHVQTYVGNAGLNALDLGFRLLPVLGVLLLTAQSLPGFQQLVFVRFVAIERLDEYSIGPWGEANHAHVDAYGRGRRIEWRHYLTSDQDRNEPLASRLPDGDVPHLTSPEDLLAVAVANPAKLR